MKDVISLDLPWPPTINHYWLQRGKRKFLSERAHGFRAEVFAAFSATRCPGFDADARLGLSIIAYPPDKRKRDLDNLFKALLDSLEHAGVFFNDNQIDRLYIERKEAKLNKVIVTICSLKP